MVLATSLRSCAFCRCDRTLHTHALSSRFRPHVRRCARANAEPSVQSSPNFIRHAWFIPWPVGYLEHFSRLQDASLVELEYSWTLVSCGYHILQLRNRNDFIILIHSTDLRKVRSVTYRALAVGKNLPKVYFWNLSFFIGVFNGSYV